MAITQKEWALAAYQATADNIGTQFGVDDSFKETDGAYADMTRRLPMWRNPTVHGTWMRRDFKDPKSEVYLDTSPDLDSDCAIHMIKAAGIDVQQVRYVPPGETNDNSVNLDTGGESGVKYVPNRNALILDHHDIRAGGDLSATLIAKETLMGMGLMQEENPEVPVLGRIAQFVTAKDNLTYPAYLVRHSHRTMYGLAGRVSNAQRWELLTTYFEEFDDGEVIMDDETIKRLQLDDVHTRQADFRRMALGKLNRAKRQEGAIRRTKLGRTLITTGRNIPGGSETARLEFDGHVNTDGTHTKVSSMGGEPLTDLVLDRLGTQAPGKLIRNQMWIVNDPAEHAQWPLERVLEVIDL